MTVQQKKDVMKWVVAGAGIVFTAGVVVNSVNRNTDSIKSNASHLREHDLKFSKLEAMDARQQAIADDVGMIKDKLMGE